MLHLLTAEVRCSKEFWVTKPLSMASFSDGEIFWLIHNGALMAHTEWLPGAWLNHFSTTCAAHIEDCEGCWLPDGYSSAVRALVTQARVQITSDCWLLLCFISYRWVCALYFWINHHFYAIPGTSGLLWQHFWYKATFMTASNQNSGTAAILELLLLGLGGNSHAKNKQKTIVIRQLKRMRIWSDE